MKRGIWILSLAALLAQPASSQSERPHWQRGAAARLGLQLFHSQHAFNLPTAEVLRKREMEFEISHRFLPPLKEGLDTFYGLDGPVNMRLALSFALTDHWQAALGRTNASDQIDLQIKRGGLQLTSGTLPLLLGAQAGAAWNTQVIGRDRGNSRNVQFYGQLILNTLYAKRLGVGLVPTWLYNSDILSPDRQYALTLGGYVQYWLGRSFSLCAEWIPTLSGTRHSYNTVSFGLERETGGHFFKILVSNNAQLNTALIHGGADTKAGAEGWRLGFMITRLFKL